MADEPESPIKFKSSMEDASAVENLFKDLDAPEMVPVAQPEPPAEPVTEPESEKLPEAEITPEPKPRKDESDEEFEKRMADVQLKPSSHPKTKEAFERTKSEIKEYRELAKEAQRQAKESEEKLSKLETEYKGKVITPEIEQELTELRERRREFHIEQDPEFRAKYSTKLQQIDERALGILVATQLPPAWAKFITDNGGVVAMSSSAKQMPAGKFENQTYQQFIEDTLMPRMPEIQQTRLKNSIAAGMDLRDEMSREIEHAKSHGSELQQKRQKDIQDKFEAAVRTTRSKLGKMAEKWEYPADATKEQRESVDKHNARQEKAAKAFEDFLKNGKNPEKVAEFMVLAAQSEYLMEANQDFEAEREALNKKVLDLEGRLKKVKGSASHGRENNAPPPSTAPKDIKKMSDEDAFNQEFGKNAR